MRRLAQRRSPSSRPRLAHRPFVDGTRPCACGLACAPPAFALVRALDVARRHVRHTCRDVARRRKCRRHHHRRAARATSSWWYSGRYAQNSGRITLKLYEGAVDDTAPPLYTIALMIHRGVDNDQIYSYRWKVQPIAFVGTARSRFTVALRCSHRCGCSWYRTHVADAGRFVRGGCCPMRRTRLTRRFLLPHGRTHAPVASGQLDSALGLLAVVGWRTIGTGWNVPSSDALAWHPRISHHGITISQQPAHRTQPL